MSRLWHTHGRTDRWKVEQYSVWAESAILRVLLCEFAPIICPEQVLSGKSLCKSSSLWKKDQCNLINRGLSTPSDPKQSGGSGIVGIAASPEEQSSHTWTTQCICWHYIKDGSGCQNRWIFGKVPNSLGPPLTPHFRKIMLHFFRWKVDQKILFKGLKFAT